MVLQDTTDPKTPNSIDFTSVAQLRSTGYHTHDPRAKEKAKGRTWWARITSKASADPPGASAGAAICNTGKQTPQDHQPNQSPSPQGHFIEQLTRLKRG